EGAPAVRTLAVTPPDPEDHVLPDQLDLEPQDPEQLQETQMLANLILACSARPTRLSDLDIDGVLGLSHETGQHVA
ncbi:MAG: hypothetical protein M3211_04475, partial [Actinomycetota bacterium]|nr:hypothetical protein [Actinomycetota bacterium]